MPAPETLSSLKTSADQLRSATENGTPRRRRKSSGLGQHIHAGDTGPSLGTGLASIYSSDSSSTTSSNHHGHQPGEQKKVSKRRRAPSFLRRNKHFAVKHTWTLPLLLLLAFLSLYAINPTESNIIHHFIFLSYKLSPEAGADPSTPSHYGKGLWDVAFVSFYTILLSFTREFIMQELLRPLARLCGLESRRKQSRFMEQMYTALYFGLMGPAGMYVMSRTPVWYFNTRGMYETFPHKTHEAVFKFYYLFQAAYWAQQAIVLLLGMEKPRKDFKELVGHHIVTLALIALSYRFHFTYIGIAVYLTHDISDFFLAVSRNRFLYPLGVPWRLPGKTLTRICSRRHRKHSTISTAPYKDRTSASVYVYGFTCVTTSICALFFRSSPSSTPLVPTNLIGKHSSINAYSPISSLSGFWLRSRLLISFGCSAFCAVRTGSSCIGLRKMTDPRPRSRSWRRWNARRRRRSRF